MEPGLSVNQCALPGAVPSIRAAVSRFLDAYHLSPRTDADIALAVTEACSNVVRHAYPNGTGDVHCEANVAEREVVIVVSDHGCGLQTAPYQPELRLGMGLMGMLADSMTVRGDGDGTEITLRFNR